MEEVLNLNKIVNDNLTFTSFKINFNTNANIQNTNQIIDNLLICHDDH